MPQQPGRFPAEASAGNEQRVLIPAPIRGEMRSVVHDTRLAEVISNAWPLRVRAPKAAGRRRKSEPFASASSASARSARPSRGWPPIAPPPRTPACASTLNSALVRDVGKPRDCPEPGAAHGRSRRRFFAATTTSSSKRSMPSSRRARWSRDCSDAARRSSRPTRRWSPSTARISNRSRRHAARRFATRRPRWPPCRFSARSPIGRSSRRSIACCAIVNGTSNFLLTSLGGARRVIRSGAGRARRSSATPSPIRRAISTASMPPTSCCCSRRSLDGDGCRRRRSTSAASAA